MAGAGVLGRLAAIGGRTAARTGRFKVNPLALLLGDASARVKMPDAPDSIVPMYGFAVEDDGCAYMITTDELFGGKSRASFWVKPYKHFRAGVFEGMVEFASDEYGSRGGFCNARLRQRQRLFDDDLVMMETEALQLRVKTDGRPYLINFQCSDTTDEDVWQAEVRTDPFRWETLALPWSGFAHVSRGLVKESQLDLEPHKIDGFGITIADGRNGPFRCELQFVRALKAWQEHAWSPATASVSGSMSERDAWEQEQEEQEEAQTRGDSKSKAGQTSDGKAADGSDLAAQRRAQRDRATAAAISRRAARRAGTNETAAPPEPGQDSKAGSNSLWSRADALLDRLSGPQVGVQEDGRRVTPYAMTDDQRSRWRSARDRRGRRAVMDEPDTRS